MKKHKFSKKKCKTCKKFFWPKSSLNIFCCRKHFKQNYYLKERKKKLNDLSFPSYNCSNCGQQGILNFDPLKNQNEWLTFSCPGCKLLIINIYDRITTREITRKIKQQKRPASDGSI